MNRSASDTQFAQEDTAIKVHFYMIVPRRSPPRFQKLADSFGIRELSGLVGART